MYSLLTTLVSIPFNSIAIHIATQVLDLITNAQLPEQVCVKSQCLASLVIRAFVLLYVRLDRINCFACASPNFGPLGITGHRVLCSRQQCLFGVTARDDRILLLLCCHSLAFTTPRATNKLSLSIQSHVTARATHQTSRPIHRVDPDATRVPDAPSSARTSPSA